MKRHLALVEFVTTIIEEEVDIEVMVAEVDMVKIEAINVVVTRDEDKEVNDSLIMDHLKSASLRHNNLGE